MKSTINKTIVNLSFICRAIGIATKEIITIIERKISDFILNFGFLPIGTTFDLYLLKHCRHHPDLPCRYP